MPMTMTPEAAAALEESIAHWKRNVEAMTVSEAQTGPEFCALCDLFNGDDLPHDMLCKGCPVREHTGAQFCVGTPYLSAERALADWIYEEDAGHSFRHAARAELAFLESLRDPPAEQS